jgi:hypothetical protein
MISSRIKCAIIGMVYSVVVVCHYHAYVYWAEAEEHRCTLLHLVSIGSHLVSLYLGTCHSSALGAVAIMIANLCHNYLIHVWNTVLATTSFMSRMRLQGVNDLTCTVALSVAAVRSCRPLHPSISWAVAILLTVHCSLFLGQAMMMPVLDRVVVTFYPETVIEEGGPLHSCFNLLRWLAVQSDISSSTFLMVALVQSMSRKPTKCQ